MRLEVLNRGEVIETKDLTEGSYKIGRSSTCEIQLKSPQVSKQHAMIVVKGDKAAVVDMGSSNGIFVNGILVRKQRIDIGDEVVIADYQIRLVSTKRKITIPQVRSAGETPMEPIFGDNLARQMSVDQVEQNQAIGAMSPQDKLILLMDEKVLAPFYVVMRQVDWRVLLLSIQGLTLIAAVFLSVFPIVRWGKRIVTEEALARAHTVVSQSVRENYRIITKSDDYTRMTVEACETEQGILSCLVVDPKANVVLAPAKYLNKPITDFYMLAAMKRITEKHEDYVSEEKELGLYVVAQPVAIFSPGDSDKVPRAVVVAEFEIPAKVYSTFEPLVEAALFAILCSLLGYFFIFKMFTYPVVSLTEQLDSALKGDDLTITSQSKSPEMEGLATVMNFSVSRLKQANGGMVKIAQSADDVEAQDKDYVQAVELFDQGTSDALLLLAVDKKVSYVGRVLEELIGMRNQYAIGQNVSDACRDQAFAGTVIDLVERVIGSLGETQQGQLDVNGVNRNIAAVAHRNHGGDIRHVLVIIKMAG